MLLWSIQAIGQAHGMLNLTVSDKPDVTSFIFAYPTCSWEHGLKLLLKSDLTQAGEQIMAETNL